MVELRVSEVCVDAGAVRLVHDASLTLRSGELVAVIGENGAGKSSLLRGIIGYHRPSAGSVAVAGQALHHISASARARLIGWLPQNIALAWPILVRDAVALGRFGHGGVPARLGDTDQRIVDRLLADCDLLALADRNTATLSGGELARVHLARCLAAQAPFLLADEPVAALDPRHRIAVMTMLRGMAQAGTGVLVVLHDLALAARFADRIVAMEDGRIIADARPVDVMTPAMLMRLFGIEFRVETQRGWPEPTSLV